MKIVELQEDLYNIHGRSLDDYAWITSNEMESYLYASVGDFFVYDEVEECYVNHSSSIPKIVIEGAKHKVSNFLDLIYQMKDTANNTYDISNLRGEALRRFIEIDVDNYEVGKIDYNIDDHEVGISVEINKHIYIFNWVGADPFAHFKYRESSEEAKESAKCFLLDTKIDLIQNLIEKD